MPTSKMREFITEAYSRNIRSDVIARVTKLDVKYIYRLVYRRGLREVQGMAQEDEALEIAEEMGVDIEEERRRDERRKAKRRERATNGAGRTGLGFFMKGKD